MNEEKVIDNRYAVELPALMQEKVDSNIEEDKEENDIVNQGKDGESDLKGVVKEEFPLSLLSSLDEQLSRPKWVVPVRENDELETLIKAAIDLARNGKDVACDPCQRFFREGLTTSFIRILTDDAVNTWKPDIQLDIYRNARLLVELCVLKIDGDSLVLLDLLAILFNPSCKWNVFNGPEPSVTLSQTADITTLYATTLDSTRHSPKGRLVDMLNQFGKLGGFDGLFRRICKMDNLTVPVLSALLKPFGQCSNFFTDHVYKEYIVPIVDQAVGFLDNIDDESLKKEAATDSRSETFSSIMKSLRQLCRRIPGREDVETFRLKMILRLLQISSFSGKMNALNEINKIIPTTFHPQFRNNGDDENLAVDRIAYVEKLDRLVRFCIKEKVLTLEDLDCIWACQDGKHEAIVKNIHDLLVKLAWDFSPEQLEHLFGCFQKSWVTSSKKQRDELLDFIRHLAEDDKDGIMATKVLQLLWNLAHREDCPLDTMDHALNAHIKILDYSCSQERESQKLQWLHRCVDEVTQGGWVIPALKHMKEICLLYLESPVNYSNVHHSTRLYYRNEMIGHLDQNHHLLAHICSNLNQYMSKVHHYLKDNPGIDPETLCIDGRFNHYQQLQIRLDFLRFALKDGQLWLGHNQAILVWDGLALSSAFPSDKDACFRWFAKLATWDEPDIEPETAKRLFTENILRLSPSSLTENGFRCFDKFFRMVNLNQHGLSKWNRSCFVTESVDDLIGLDYIWECILQVHDSIVHKPIELMKDIYTNLSTKLPQEQIHHEFITVCMQRMELIFNALHEYKPGEIDKESSDMQARYATEVNKLVRCLKLLMEYMVECDDEYMEERGIPPHGKAAWGKPLVLTVRYIHSHQPEDVEISTHSHETISALRRKIAKRYSIQSQSKLELSVGNEIIRKTDNHHYVISCSIPLRDKMVITVRQQQQQQSNISETSVQSSDNSTDSSEGSVVGAVQGPNMEAERTLPSVLMANQETYIDFLLGLCDFAVKNKLCLLRDSARHLLRILPTSAKLLRATLKFCHETSKSQSPLPDLRQYVLSNSPSKVVYILEVIQSLLMPAVESREADSNTFQFDFIACGGLDLLFSILTSQTFLCQGDISLKRSALMCCLKMLKLLLVCQAYAFIITVSQEIKANSGAINGERHQSACHVQDAINTIIPSVEQQLKALATTVAKTVTEKLTSPVPDSKLIEAMLYLCWSSSIGNISLVFDQHTLQEAHNKPYSLEQEDVHLTKETLEVMALSMAVSPTVLDNLCNKPVWRPFLVDIVLRAKNRLIRVSAQEQLFHSITRCCTETREVLLGSITLLFDALETNVRDCSITSNEFFRLLARLINHAYHQNVPLEGVQELLEKELQWLNQLRDKCFASDSVSVEGSLLEGHLNIIVELLSFVSVEQRFDLGSKPGGMELISKLVKDFLFPASRIVKLLRKNSNVQYSEQLSQGICNSLESTLAAYKCINALCKGSLCNIELLKDLLFDLFYSEEDMPINEWEFLPQLGSRPSKGFVGLKNAGATCYLNSVLQQVYGISPVRRAILSIEKPAEELVKHENSDDNVSSTTEDRKETNRKVLMQVQSIFGHLQEGKVQFHVPKGFWRDFRLDGAKINLREQHDAFEFFNTLVDSVDEGLKCYGASPIFSKVFGGSFADQKICKSCPHRYSREEPFTAINVDIRLHHNLFESLDSYVKGDLLEGANAYHCEKCNKKVDTVKRMCIKKLPQCLVIQLKRFDYDWEREMAVKFNDYFEFPREFDVSPYTADGLAKREGEEIPDSEEKKSDAEDTVKKEVENELATTSYRLRGIVVHSGQASGGHYYSFIRVKPPGAESVKWYKFDDGDVIEAKMDDEEEFKSQCFGGEYTGEVYDHVLKKSHQRRQKRWWSAYLLFYDRVAENGQPISDLEAPDEQKTTVPSPILKLVYHQNLDYLHMRSHFSSPYFQFIKHLLIINYTYAKTQIDTTTNTSSAMENFEKLGMVCMQLATKFLFHSGFHTKKTLRGSANEWFEALNPYLHYSARIRRWFCEEVFISHKQRFYEYILDCTSTELRNMFAKLIPHLCHITNKDERFEVHTPTNTGINVSLCLFSDIAIHQLLQLLKKEVSEHSRHLQQYFQVFLTYCHKGAYERQQLIRLGVPAHFIAVALDEGPGPPLRSPYADLTKLYSVVGILVRCCDVSVMQRSATEGADLLPNPYSDPELCVKLPTDLCHWLYERSTIMQHNTNYVKKLMEDSCPIDETLRFLGFCSWENWEFSAVVVADLLVEITTAQPFDMRPYLDLLHHLLLMEDSLQVHRLRAAYMGIQDRADGMMVFIQHGQTHVVHQKRAYLCIKFIVNLCNRCQTAQILLEDDSNLKQLWQHALRWLQSELERRQFTTSTYPYAGWSPPAQSNEVSNSYFLERSNSAKMTLSKARELFPAPSLEMIQQTQTHHYDTAHTQETADTSFNQPSDEINLQEFHSSHDPKDTLDSIDEIPPRDHIDINDSSITHADVD